MSYLNNLTVSGFTVGPDYFSETVTEDDPDGAGRGGYHQLTESITVEGAVLKYEQQVSDFYEDRMGEIPEPNVENKSEAIRYLEAQRSVLTTALQKLDALLTAVQATTEFAAKPLHHPHV